MNKLRLILILFVITVAAGAAYASVGARPATAAGVADCCGSSCCDGGACCHR